MVDGCGQMFRWDGEGTLGHFRIKHIWFLKGSIAEGHGDLGILDLGVLESLTL